MEISMDNSKKFQLVVKFEFLLNQRICFFFLVSSQNSRITQTSSNYSSVRCARKCSSKRSHWSNTWAQSTILNVNSSRNTHTNVNTAINNIRRRVCWISTCNAMVRTTFHDSTIIFGILSSILFHYSLSYRFKWWITSQMLMLYKIFRYQREDAGTCQEGAWGSVEMQLLQ